MNLCIADSSVMGRVQHCLQQAVVLACKCRDISLPEESRYSHLPFCNDDSHIPEHCRREAADDCFTVETSYHLPPRHSDDLDNDAMQVVL